MVEEGHGRRKSSRVSPAPPRVVRKQADGVSIEHVRIDQVLAACWIRDDRHGELELLLILLIRPEMIL